MDINILRGLLTAVLMGAFIGMVIWAYSGKRKGHFAEAALLPLQEAQEVEKAKSGDRP